MQYIKLVIVVEDPYEENVIADLSEMGFNAFEQLDNALITYIPATGYDSARKKAVKHILNKYPGNNYLQTEQVIADRNWNEEWEKTIQARRIGTFFVKATWDKSIPPDDCTLLEINPKMAFGTGYHETTRLMLQFLSAIVKPGDAVLDAGTGSGILAIAAVKSGARSVFAFDIDQWSIDNAEENIKLNNVENSVELKKGSVEVIPKGGMYNLILANINRNAIVTLLPIFKAHLAPGGKLLLSGLLHSDKEEIEQQAAANGLEIREQRRENEWIALHLCAYS